MPMITTITNVCVTEAQRAAMQKRMGDAISLLPGKSEAWLMLCWRDATPMAFQGSNEPCALCEVKLYGAAAPEHYDRLTGALCRMVEEEIGVPAARVYVTYQEIENWGFNGHNF